jgi:hypothetical protein
MARIEILENQTMAEVAGALLDLVDANPDVFTPRDVATNTDNGMAFIVPDGLEQLYLEYLTSGKVGKAELEPDEDVQEPDESDESDDGEDTSTDEAPAPKKRGRPRKIQTEG